MRAHLWIILTLSALLTCGAIRRDEFLCEEAHARLVECCPGFRTEPGYCTYSSGCGDTTYPALATEESECIRKSSCDALRKAGLCEQLAARTASSEDARAQGVRVVCR